jgi:hypothetical protein
MRGLTRFVVPAALAATAALWSGRASATLIPSPRAVSAFYTPDDGYMHAIVAQTDGSVREVYFKDFGLTASALLTTLPNMVGVSGYYTPADRYRHVIVALANGQIWHVSYNPGVGISQSLLTTVDLSVEHSIVSVAAWANPDNSQNFVVATAGNLIHYTFSASSALRVAGKSQGVMGQVDIAAWNGNDYWYGNMNHLAVIAFWDNATSIAKFSWSSDHGYLTYPYLHWDYGAYPTTLGSISGFAYSISPGSTDDILYVDRLNDSSPLGVIEDFTSFDANGYATPTGIENPITGPGFTVPLSIAAAQDTGSGMRHAIVGLFDGEVRDYIQLGNGAGKYYALGSY